MNRENQNRGNQAESSAVRTIEMTDADNNGFRSIMSHIRQFCRQNPCSVGAAEIVCGAFVITLGVKIGAVEMGSKLVGIDGNPFNAESFLTGGGSGAVGTAAGLLGGIGVAGLGSAIGISAPVLAALGAAVGFTTGYTVGDLTHNLLNPGVDWLALIGGGSLLAIGLALILDGCRRIVGSAAFKRAVSFLKARIIYLGKSTRRIVCRTTEELKDWAVRIVLEPGTVVVPVTCATLAGSAGALAGGTLAASSVTVLGSHALGSAALSLGLVAAPVWPVIACGVGAAAVGVGGWVLVRRWFSDLSSKREGLMTAKV